MNNVRIKEVVFNADVGEEVGFDHLIIPKVSWCNIACGAHAGSKKTIQEVVELALQHNTKIGAHPSYPDRENFGRLPMEMDMNQLMGSVKEQVELVKYLTEKQGGKLHHVKLHGALYHEANKNIDVALAIRGVLKNIDKSLLIITQEKSKFFNVCSEVFEVKKEVFIDRNYNDDLTLVSRKERGAVIHDFDSMKNHVLEMVEEGSVTSLNGKKIKVDFDTICVHGDHQNAMRNLDQIVQFLEGKGYKLKS